MILLLMLLVPVFLVSLRIYLKSTPKHMDKRTGTLYNFIIFTLSLGGCFMVCLYTYFTTGQSVDRAWWPILSGLGSLFVFPVVLLIGGICRNVILFRKRAN